MISEKTSQFWKTIFDGFEEATPLAFGYGASSAAGDWIIPVSTSTEQGIVVAAWALLQSRNSGERFVCVGVREHGIEAAHPVRLEINEDLPAEHFLASISEQLDAQLRTYSITESDLQGVLQLPSEKSLFNCFVSCSLENECAIAGDGGFSADTLSRVGGHLERVLDRLPAGVPAGTPVKDIQHMSNDELDRVLREWNPEPTPYPEVTLHALVERQAVERSDAIAFISAAGQVTYEKLNALANRLAHFLIRDGVLPGQGVAIFLDRGLWQTASPLAILKAGAGYIPLDVDFPPERISQMLEDAQPSIIISSSDVAEKLEGSCGAKVVLIDRFESELDSFSSANPSVACSPDSLAYIMYTSGSTGRPKGVEVRHRGIVRLLVGVDYVPLNSETIILHMAAVSFDASTFEIWGALLHGGTCVLCQSRVPTIEKIGRLLAEHKVNTFWMTAALFNLVITEAPEILSPVKYLLAGGEALSSWHVERALGELPDLQLINGYGPTENTTFSTTYAFDRETFDSGKPIPIGRAIGNSSCYILDRMLRPVPVGVPGELYVGGDGVATGYVNRPDLTSERFLDDPFSKCAGARMYKTGDVVYWNHEGLIEFIGRDDNQIKLRGFRIELQDIELVLSSFPGVEQAVVQAYDDEVRGKWLAGFVKIATPSEFSMDELEKFAYGKLPDYMVPAVLVPVDDWTYTPSGKLDRKALPKPMHSAPPGVEFKLPENDTQKVLVEIWQRLLQQNRVGINDDFFDLGGDSLRGVHMLHEICLQFGKDLPLATLNQYPTIYGLASRIDGEGEGEMLMDGFRCLQMIQKGGSGIAPLFLVHGGAGNVIVFRDLAHNLGAQQPVYAFQWSGWDGDRGHDSIVAMAAAYKEEMMRFFPSEKYRIGGHCIGGLIAVELARQLKEEGVGIDGPIVVSDSPNLKSSRYLRQEPESKPDSRRAFSRMLEDLEQRTLPACKGHYLPALEEPKPGLVSMLKSLPSMISLVGWTRTVSRRSKILMIQLRGRKVPINMRPFYSSFTLVSAVKSHSNSSLEGDIVYFRSGCVFGRNMGLQGWWDDPYMGFSEICEGEFDAYVIGGGHNEVLDNPEVAAILKRKFSGSVYAD